MGKVKHGHSYAGRKSPTYRAWAAAKNRCTNPRNDAFKDYGGRGITFSKRWMFFATFLADMGERPRGATLDRINNDLGYNKRNCRWSTRKTQARNRRSSRMITIRGVKKTVAEWCEINGLNQNTALMRLNEYGWPPARAVTEPARRITQNG